MSIIGSFNYAVYFNNIISPPQLLVDQNNYSPLGIDEANVIRINISGNRNITGIKAPIVLLNKILLLINNSSTNLTLVNNSASSLPENRFLLNGSHILNGQESVMLMYDNVDLRWRILAENL